ncbi:MAG: DUF6265 family protein [Pseudomonadota bacterium]
MSASNSVSVDRMAWLTGEWVGGLGEQHVEEVWSAPRHGCIENKVRLSDPDTVALIELMMVRESVDEQGAASLTLRLRQFDGELNQVTDQLMVLDELTDTRAAFKASGEGKLLTLSYTQTAPGEMDIDVGVAPGVVVTAKVSQR